MSSYRGARCGRAAAPVRAGSASSLHWAIAVLLPGLFALGLWMVEFGYYDAWSQRAPWRHKGFGVLLVATVAFRLAWRWANPRSRPEPGHAPWGNYRCGFEGGTTLVLRDFGIDYDLGPASQQAELTLSIEGIRK